jgi:hypothetical protein
MKLLMMMMMIMQLESNPWITTFPNTGLTTWQRSELMRWAWQWRHLLLDPVNWCKNRQNLWLHFFTVQCKNDNTVTILSNVPVCYRCLPKWAWQELTKCGLREIWTFHSVDSEWLWS